MAKHTITLIPGDGIGPDVRLPQQLQQHDVLLQGLEHQVADRLGRFGPAVRLDEADDDGGAFSAPGGNEAWARGIELGGGVSKQPLHRLLASRASTGVTSRDGQRFVQRTPPHADSRRCQQHAHSVPAVPQAVERRGRARHEFQRQYLHVGFQDSTTIASRNRVQELDAGESRHDLAALL